MDDAENNNACKPQLQIFYSIINFPTPPPIYYNTHVHILCIFLGEPTCLLLLDATRSKSRHTLNVNTTLNRESKHVCNVARH